MDETGTLTNSIEKTEAAAAETSAQRKRRERTRQLMQDPPSREQLEQELVRVRTDRKRGRVLRSIVMTIITVAAAAALVSTLFLPILRIYGTSMAPTLEEKDLLVAVKTNHVHQGELVAFYFNNKILVKRVIAGPGDWVDINEAGDVIVNGRALSEPYLTSKSKGQTTDITYPYQVPDGKYFQVFPHGGSPRDLDRFKKLADRMHRAGPDGRPNPAAGMASQSFRAGEVGTGMAARPLQAARTGRRRSCRECCGDQRGVRSTDEHRSEWQNSRETESEQEEPEHEKGSSCVEPCRRYLYLDGTRQSGVRAD